MTAPTETPKPGRLAALLGFTPGRADAAAAFALLALTIGEVIFDSAGSLFLGHKQSVVKSGLSILWNPNVGLGEPMLANPAYGAIYPLNFIFYLTDPARALAIFTALHFLALCCAPRASGR